jgi:putative Holliday junction resolvase
MGIISVVDVNMAVICGNARVLGIDYGDKRIGLAISDISWLIASPLQTIDSHGCFRPILEIIDSRSIGWIVVGLPLALNGDVGGIQLDKVKKFTEKLATLAANTPITFWDERFSTSAANRCLAEAEMKLRKRKYHVDKIAASFMLQGLLNTVTVS